MVVIMKLSAYFKAVDNFQGDASAHYRDAEKAVAWYRKLSELASKMRDEADAFGLPPDAQERLDAYRKMLDEGPPDGSMLGGASPEQKLAPQRRRKRTRAQIAHDEAAVRSGRPDLVGKYESAALLDTSEKAAETLGSAHEPPREVVHPAEIKTADQKRVNLAGRICARVEKEGPVASSALCVEFELASGEFDRSISLTSLVRWVREGVQMVGTWEHLVAEAGKLSIKSGDRIGETAAALSVSTDTAVRMWKHILDKTPQETLLAVEKAT